jgi:hypothetical protein
MIKDAYVLVVIWIPEGQPELMTICDSNPKCTFELVVKDGFWSFWYAKRNVRRSEYASKQAWMV